MVRAILFTFGICLLFVSGYLFHAVVQNKWDREHLTLPRGATSAYVPFLFTNEKKCFKGSAQRWDRTIELIKENSYIKNCEFLLVAETAKIVTEVCGQ